MSWNPVKIIKRWLAKRKHEAKMKKKLEELKKKDPYIYD